MMFVATIHTDNAAFQGRAQGGSEVARILTELADELIERGLPQPGDLQTTFKLYDVNGNHVGHAAAVWRADEG